LNRYYLACRPWIQLIVEFVSLSPTPNSTLIAIDCHCKSSVFSLGRQLLTEVLLNTALLLPQIHLYTMAQGNHKLGKAGGRGGAPKRAKSAGAKKRQTTKSKKMTRKGSAAIERNQGIVAATKAINRKNERIIAAKACTAGTNFYLKDIAEKGEKLSFCAFGSLYAVRVSQSFDNC
jgi:hypothetical protein